MRLPKFSTENTFFLIFLIIFLKEILMVSKKINRLSTKCMPIVKSEVIKYSHIKCSTDRKAVEVTGVVLNWWLRDTYGKKASTVPFEQDVVYTICHTLDKMIKNSYKDLLIHSPPPRLDRAPPVLILP